MRGRGRIAGVGLAGGIALAALVGPAATPATADCLYLDFWLIIQDTDGDGHDEPAYVHQGCVTETDYSWNLSVPAGGRQDGVPEGAPKGFYFQTHIPLPPD